MTSDCIFESQPKECQLCLDSRKLQCLLNKQHLVVRPGIIGELHQLLAENINHPDRYKTVSGENGRKT